MAKRSGRVLIFARMVLLGIGLFQLTVKGRCQDGAALAARLHATAARTSLDTAGLLPWHLKIDVQLYDSKGQPAEKGTVEEWWASRELNRVTYSFASHTSTELHTKSGVFHTKDQGAEPILMDDLLEQVVHSTPRESEIDEAKPDLRKQSFGKVALECIMLDQPLKQVAYPPLGLFPTFCLDPGAESLRISTEYGSEMFVRNNIGRFQDRSVAVDVTAESSGKKDATAHVSTLSTLALAETEFTPGVDMEPVGVEAARIGAG